ncbi:MAG TPA: dTDP-4-dehydrorhamnose 3,5-epimerase [Candidatus Saccharimonadales bacterium]|nr:dTDP-4-dehydrorhamnose 3,5-epimerase [Candidatus Saccharimonadales bacterium]
MNQAQNTPKITPFEIQSTDIDGLFIITMRQIEDSRGVIRELFRASALKEAGLAGFKDWKQINATETKQGVVRGLHGEDMWKLVAIVSGEAFGAYVDVRLDSPTKGRVVTAKLVPGMQVLVPQGVCNGFQSVSEGSSQYLYCFDQEWVLGMKGYSLTPLDPELEIQWPIPIDPNNENQISHKDVHAPKLKEVIGA